MGRGMKDREREVEWPLMGRGMRDWEREGGRGQNGQGDERLGEREVEWVGDERLGKEGNGQWDERLGMGERGSERAEWAGG